MRRKTLDGEVSDFAHAVRMLVRRVRAASGPQEFSWSQAAVMARLADDGPATTADLARAERITPQSMGAIVTALEVAGFVDRKAHPTDGRRVRIALTTGGAAARRHLREARLAWLVRAVDGLDDEERRTLFEAADIIERLAAS